MPRKILLATLEAPSDTGGIARYIDAIKKTFPREVTILELDQHMGRSAMSQAIRAASAGKGALWIHHILPIGTIAWLFSSLPYVIFLHGMDFDLARRNVWKRWLTKRILKKAERVVTNSKALAKEVEEFAQIDEPMVVYPCVSDELAEKSKVESQKSKVQEKRMVLLTVSRFVARKGHVKVLEAIKDLPNVTYKIVGDGPAEEMIERKIIELGLEDRVELLGRLDDQELVEAYQAADVFVMPTTKTKYDREGFGIVYLEAQLFGLPVIATHHPGVDEAVIDRGTGFLIEDQPELIRDTIKKLANDKELRTRMGKAGREFVLGGFTREKQMSQLSALTDR